MASSPSIGGLIDVRSSGILTDYIHSHEPCAPGAATYAKKRMYEIRLKLYRDNLEQEEAEPANQDAIGESSSRPLTDSRVSQIRNDCGGSKPHSDLNPYGGNYFSGASGGLGDISWALSSYDVGYGKGKGQQYGGVTNSGGNAMQNSKPASGSGQDPVTTRKPSHAAVHADEEEDESKFDRPRDWLTCFGACVIVGCILGIVQSYAVFAPAIQHHYETGLVETILVGCLCYFTLLCFVPVSLKITRCLGNRWAAMLGMLLFMVGLLVDGLTVGGVFGLYFTHIVFMGIGGSIAYVPAMIVCSDHFRKHLGYALTAVSCAAPVGTMCIYLLSTLMTNYISYAWTKFCLAILVLICMGASNAFPLNSHRTNWRVRKDKEAKRRLRQCFKNLALERDEKLKAAAGPGRPPRTCHFVFVCDISFCDPFLAIWAGLTLVATCTIFIPYLFLISYAYDLASTSSLGLICCCCLASVCTRLVVMNMNNHTFTFNRTVFQLSLIASGSLYISLNWADTFGWVLLWGLIAGAVEGVECIIIPRVTLQTVPFATLNASCRWMTFFHACSVILGPMLLLCVYYSTTDYAPAMVAIGIAQLIAAFLVFLMPNVEEDELERLEKQERELAT